MEFEWDDAKSASNESKHGVTFADAVTLFGDPLAITVYDPDHSADEDRYVTMGLSITAKLLIVSHTDRGDQVRLISAREATRAERRDYEDGNFP